jgi:hypothetical protein
MTRISWSGERSAARLSREPRFESSAIYALVAGLYVRTYEDLLAPHWTVSDGTQPAERLDAGRFVRQAAAGRSHVLVALPSAGPVEASDAELTTASVRTVAVVPAGTEWERSVRILVPRPEPVPPGNPASTASAPVRTTLAAWRQAIGAWAARPFDALRAWWRVRRPRP